MTYQRTTSRLAFIARPEASQVARALAAVRLGIGAIGVLAPGRLAWRLFLPGDAGRSAHCPRWLP